MRELEYTFAEGLKKGLRPDDSNPRNSQYCVELYNAECCEFGIRPYRPLGFEWSTDVFTHTGIDHPTYEWPFPQLFKFRDGLMLASKTKLYNLTGTTLTYTNATVTAVGNNEPWRMADAGLYRVAVCNQSTVACRSGLTGVWSSGILWDQIPVGKTVVLHRGQLIMANCIWAVDATYDSGTVAWSDIGSANFVIGPLASSGYQLRSANVAGYNKVLSTGAILELVPLGKSVIVYGADGIVSMTPVTAPAPTFAWEEVANFGIHSKGAVGGHSKEHIFIGRDYSLYRLSTNGLERLGYSEFIRNTLASTFIVISYDNLLDRYFLAKDGTAYVLTKYGLSRVSYYPTSIITNSGYTYAMSSSTAPSSAGYMLVKTDILDFGLRAEKTVYSVELGISGYEPTGFFVTVFWKNVLSSGFSQTSAIPVNSEGVANIVISGTEFQFQVHNTSEDLEWTLSYIKIRYKVTGKKSLHGSYAPQGDSYAS